MLDLQQKEKFCFIGLFSNIVWLKLIFIDLKSFDKQPVTVN